MCSRRAALVEDLAEKLKERDDAGNGREEGDVDKMGFLNPHSTTFITADTTDVLANDAVLRNLGPGRYRVYARAAAAADATITINDGTSNVVDTQSIPVRAAAVTYPEVRTIDDTPWVVKNFAADRLRITVTDGTNAEITLVVFYDGR